jgi:hypothetical protein
MYFKEKIFSASARFTELPTCCLGQISAFSALVRISAEQAAPDKSEFYKRRI